MLLIRVFIATLLAAFLFTSAAVAQQKNDAALFLSDISDGANGLGIELAHRVGTDFSVQLAVASEQHQASNLVFESTNRKVRTYPVDLAFRYHWRNETRWKPYLGLGARYVNAPYKSGESVYGNGNRMHAEIVGGVELLVRPAFGIVLDGRQLFGNAQSFDPSSKASLGVSWRF